MSKYCQSSYLNTALDMERALFAVSVIERIVKEKEIEFDTIVFRGMSGAILAPLVAAKLGKELLMVRKEDNSHSSYIVEGNIATRKYIILDDLISTGETILSIFKALFKEGARQEQFCQNPEYDLRTASCEGIILYESLKGTWIDNFSDGDKKRWEFSYSSDGEEYKGEIYTAIYPFLLQSHKAQLAHYLGKNCMNED